MENLDICGGLYDAFMQHLSDIVALRSTGTLKPDNTFVSKGDLLSEEIIADYVRENLPNALLITEETYHDTSAINQAEYVITVDPIDGTENFVSGLKEWGVGVSVYKNGKHYQSMIFLPELNLSLKTGDTFVRKPDSRLCGLPSYMTQELFNTLDNSFEYRISGCCMYNMFNVITGRFAEFRHLTGCYSWDILPGLNLALEHGLNVIVDDQPYVGQFMMPGVKFHFSLKK
jgi:myo-inositol-1(or 4)-monophosphatase